MEVVNLEVWKDVNSFEGYYMVSNKGNVKSIKRVVVGTDNKKYFVKEKILTKQLDRNGYEVVLFRRSKKSYQKKVHRLVAEAFIHNEKHKPQVNHIDEVKTNNNFTNLEWVTAKENTHHGTKIKRMSREVKQINEASGTVIKIFPSVSVASKELGYSAGNIAQAARGERKRMYGYRWEYL